MAEQQTRPVLLDGIEAFVQLRLSDATMSAIALPEEIGATTFELSPGAYLASFSTSVWKADEAFVVLPGRQPLVISPKQAPEVLVASAAPIKRTTGFSQSDAAIAADFSRRTPLNADLRDGGGLLLMLRRRPYVNGQCVEAPFDVSPWQHVNISTEDGAAVAGVADHAMCDLQKGIACVHINLTPGVYHLQLGASGGEKRVIQSFWIARGYQTQLFLNEMISDGRARLSWATAKLSAHYVNFADGFDPDSSALLATEEFLHILDAKRCPRMSPVLTRLLEDARHPMGAILYWLSQTEPWEEAAKLNETLLKKLWQQLGDSPDIVSLLCASRINQKNVRDDDKPMPILSSLPMFARAWDLALDAEAHGTLRVPCGSTAARLAADALTIGPWVRFVDAKEEVRGLSVSQTDESPPVELGFSGQEFHDFVHALRRYIQSELSARVLLNSTFFTPNERLFLGLVSPNIDSSVKHILAMAGKQLRNDIRSEQDIIRALRLPLCSIQAVSESAITKLAQGTLLPTNHQLNSFLAEESDTETILRDPLQMLAGIPSQIIHSVEQEALSLLTLLYLCYRGSALIESVPPSQKQVAAMLNGLGFVVAQSERKARPIDIAKAMSSVKNHFDAYCIQESSYSSGAVYEDIEIQLSSPTAYVPGRLCVVRRRTRIIGLSPAETVSWMNNPYSYSQTLVHGPPRKTHAQPTRIKLAHFSKADYKAKVLALSRQSPDQSEHLLQVHQ